MKSVLIILGVVGVSIAVLVAMLVSGMTHMTRPETASADGAVSHRDDPPPPATTVPATAAVPSSSPNAAVSPVAQPAPPADPKPTPPPDPAPVVPAVAAPIQPPGPPPIVLLPQNARIHGFRLRLEKTPTPVASYWVDGQEYLEWSDAVRTGGDYSVELTYSCAPNAGGQFSVIAGGNHLHANTEGTGDWKNFKSFTIGKIHLAPGRTSLLVQPDGNPSYALMKLKAVKLTVAKPG